MPRNPRPRNYQRELAQHQLEQPTRLRATFAHLTGHLGDRDQVLVGWTAILAHLHALGVRRANGRWLNDRIVLRWRRNHAFPLLRGTMNARFRSPAVTTTFAVTAWMLSQVDSGQDALFRIYTDGRSGHEGDGGVGTRAVSCDDGADGLHTHLRVVR